MMFVSEKALRDLIRESLSTSEDKWTPLEDLDDLPVLVNPSLDSSLGKIDGDVIDVQFVPHDKTEFEVAVKSLTKNIPDEMIATLYRKFRDLVDDVEGEEPECGYDDTHGDVKEMKKRVATSKVAIEETIRKMVRKALSEILKEEPKVPITLAGGKRRGPISAATEDEIDDILVTKSLLDDPSGWEDVPDPESRAAHRKMVDREEGLDFDTWDTSDVDAETASDWDPEDEDEKSGPEKKGRGKIGHGVGHGEHGKDFETIAQELGFSPAGIKRLEHVALAKLTYMMDLGPEDASRLVLDAVDDYILKLAKSGELSEEEVNYMYDHGDMVAELDGFREHLHAVIRKEMKKDGIEFYPKVDDSGKPMLDPQGRQIHRGKKDDDDDDDV